MPGKAEKKNVEEVKKTENENENNSENENDNENDNEMSENKRKGKFPEFVAGANVSSYLQTVEIFFLLNKTPNNEKSLEFITCVGQETASRIISSFKPEKITDKTYEEIIKRFEILNSEDKNLFAERYRLVTRRQKDGESLDDFAIELQNIVEHCGVNNETEATFVQTMFVAGLANEKTRETMLRECDNKMNLATLLTKAKTVEMAEKESFNMRKPIQNDVNYVQNTNVMTQPKRYQRPVQRGLFERKPYDISSHRGNNSWSSPICYNCSQPGHLSRECPNPKDRKPRTNTRPTMSYHERRKAFDKRIHQLTSAMEDLKSDFYHDEETLDDEHQDEELDGSEVEETNVNNVRLGESNSLTPAFVEININGKGVLMECDTGACATICSWEDFKEKFKECRLGPCSKRFSVVSGNKIEVKGQINVKVKAKGETVKLPLVVISSSRKFIPLLGRDWLNVLVPSWRSIFTLNSITTTKHNEQWVTNTVKQLKTTFAPAFDDDLTKPIRDVVVDIRMDDKAQPFVHKPYTVAFKHREKVSQHLDALEKIGILEKVEYASWASPLVVVVKPNGDLRVCMDGSKTVNPHIITHHYPLPLIEDLITNKSGANKFALIDLRGAYQQLIVSEETKKLLVVNTHKGLYAYRRLPFGVKPAATIFQSVMDRILQDLPNVQAYIDDILIWAATDDELLERIKLVLGRLVKHNVKINAEKCQWFVPNVKYLGHILSGAGVLPNPEKVKAITAVQVPTSTTQLKAFLGMITFYIKFVPKLNIQLAPLHDLLKKDREWEWNSKCQEVFEKCKKAISSSPILTHFDPAKQITVTCDASDDGIAGVLSHKIEGKEFPVFFVSRRLSKAEKNYPILHREALAIVFAMEKFHKYVLGQTVSIVTDHKPLEGVFKSKKGGPAIIANRLQRYFLRLSIFDYTVTHKPGKDNHNADCLSRLPLEQELSAEDSMESKRCIINFLVDDSRTRLNEQIIREASEKDETIRTVMNYVRNGWPGRIKDSLLKRFHSKRNELSIEAGCLVFQERTVIPSGLKVTALKLLHENHRGIVKMKQLARTFMYWEGLNRDIENFERSCKTCQLTTTNRAPKVYGNWPPASQPFERVHIDFFHKHNRTFLILVDAYSRWLEIKRMPTTTGKDLAQELDSIFVIFGFASLIVSDNGPPFSGHEFKEYCTKRNIEHILTPAYHPASNGLAERAVQTTKAALTKITMACDSLSSLQIDNKIRHFLHHHHQTPTTDDGIVPVSRIFAFTPRTELTGLRTTMTNPFSPNNEVNNMNYKQHDEVIYTCNVNGHNHKYPAKIVKQLSNMVYVINVNGNMKKAHRNQLKRIPKTPFYLKEDHIKTSPSEDTSHPEETITAEHTPSRYSSEETSPEIIRKSTRKKNLRHSNLNLEILQKKY